MGAVDGLGADRGLPCAVTKVKSSQLPRVIFRMFGVRRWASSISSFCHTAHKNIHCGVPATVPDAASPAYSVRSGHTVWGRRRWRPVRRRTATMGSQQSATAAPADDMTSTAGTPGSAATLAPAQALENTKLKKGPTFSNLPHVWEMRGPTNAFNVQISKAKQHTVAIDGLPLASARDKDGQPIRSSRLVRSSASFESASSRSLSKASNRASAGSSNARLSWLTSSLSSRHQSEPIRNERRMSPAQLSWDVGWGPQAGVDAPRDLGLPPPKGADIPLEEDDHAAQQPPRKPFTSARDEGLIC